MEISAPHQDIIIFMLKVSLVEVTFIFLINHTTHFNTASSNEDKEAGMIKWGVQMDGSEFPLRVGKTARKCVRKFYKSWGWVPVDKEISNRTAHFIASCMGIFKPW